MTPKLSDWNEATLALNAPRQRALNLNDIIRENVGIVDDILVALISPEAATFSVEQMVREYGYPAKDLDDVDFEYL